MRVSELIEILKTMDPDSDVRLATNFGRPKDWTISKIIEVDLGEEAEQNGAPAIVYIAQGTHLTHLSKDVAEKLGWTA